MGDIEAGEGADPSPPVAEDERDKVSDISDDDAPGSALGHVNSGDDSLSFHEEGNGGGGGAKEDEDEKRETATQTLRQSRRASSIELRKVPEHILLSANASAFEDLEWESMRNLDETKEEPQPSKIGRILRPCLNPKRSLRTQMMISFGSVSAVTILFVMVTAIIASIAAGNSFKSESRSNVVAWIKESLGASSRYVADALSPKVMPNDVVQIMYEATRDRFAGYPTVQNDSRVPFFDTTTGTNLYPLQSQALPLDWHFVPEEGNVNDENYREHVQDRWSWYNLNPRLSTVASMYTMQGACDPRVTDPSAMQYYPNCTDANNDLSKGGVVAPTPTNQQVARKAADLSPFLKALYERHQTIKELGMFFANGGAGSSIMYPHYEIDAQSSYISVGCDWMREPNPIDPSRPIGTEKEIARCHPEGEEVPSREYNPLERAWCRDQALNPDKILNGGPFLDAWNNEVWLMIVGRAVYDRVTGELITCIAVDFTLDRINEIIKDVQINDWSTFTLVRWDEEGTVVVSPNFDYGTANGPTTVDDEVLGIGMNKNTFKEMKSLVDFGEAWDPKEVSELYKEKFYDNDGKLLVGYPIPTLPDAYDPEYSPEFMVILSVDKEQGLLRAERSLEASVDDQVRSLIAFTLIIGFVGMAIVLLFIWVVATHLTEPLQWMNTIADQIVGKFDQDLDTGIDFERKEPFRFSPRTELNDLVKEFQKMVSRFSGEGTAKSAKIKPVEVKNSFTLFEEFRDLYQSRKEAGFKYDYDPSSSHFNDSDGGDEEIPERLHVGPNVHSSDGETEVAQSCRPADGKNNVFGSLLFWWIVALIVTPLLATTVSISAVVLWNISTGLPSLVVPVKDQYVDLRSRTGFTAATMRAVVASEVTGRAARDTHVITRFASWLFFGGLQMSGSTTEMRSGAEECKTSPGDGTCDFFKDKICDCDWNDRVVTACSENVEDSRSSQLAHFEGQSQDAWPNGDRNYTSFPDVDFTPSTTAWWESIDRVPGSEKGSLAPAGYETTYDRLKVLSALSTVFIPLYNYDTSKDRPLATYVGFEADGMLGGYAGCDHTNAEKAFWMSSSENGAAKMQPELCPIGKYGYDARCRGWYGIGRKMAIQDSEQLYITPPYLFSDGVTTAQSASSPLIDPTSHEHIGQTLVDFLPDSIFTSLQDNTQLAKGGFPILMTPEKDSLGFDTVIGPGFSLDGVGKSIDELVLPHDKRDCYVPDEDDCSNWFEFERILDDMRAGNASATSFSRTGANGVAEKVYLSYAPVLVKAYRPLNSSDFASGVEEYDSLIYSLALAEPERGMLEPLQSVEDSTNKQVKICIGVLVTLIVLATAFVMFFSQRVAQSLIEPIMHLLDLIRKINRLEITGDDVDDIDNLKGSCREISNVYDTMEMLYKVVRFANTAFFAGDLDEAYAVLKDALRLFTRLGNKKAIAVASNNLGNTMLSIFRTMKTTKEKQICGMTKEEVISKGIAFFGRAIKLGETAYDQFYEEEGWSKQCLGFMQHLANRYFNRGIFLLTVKDDHEKPDEAKSLGLRDLQIVEDMDIEVVDQCVEVGFTLDKAERYDLVVSRIRGLVGLMKRGCPPDDFPVEEHMAEAVKELKAAVANPSSAIFDSLSPAGRMQELDVELLRYAKVTKSDTAEAARIGIRLLVEDDYTFPDAQYKAINALINYIDAQDTEGSGITFGSDTRETLRMYQSSLEADSDAWGEVSSRITSTDTAKIRSLSKRFGSERKSSVSHQRLSVSLKESTRGDVTMETF